MSRPGSLRRSRTVAGAGLLGHPYGVVGQARKPPYVYAEVVLDGSATRLIQNVSGSRRQRLRRASCVSMPVRAVWKLESERTGALHDIEPVAN